MKHKQPCQHHWVYESPNGPTSKGVCKKCGETREDRNTIKQARAERMENPTVKYR